VNVSNQLAEIPIGLAENRLVAALKQVPLCSAPHNLEANIRAQSFVLAVVVLAVGGEDSLHDPANRIVLQLHQEVHVVGHQAVGVEIKGQLQFLLRKNTVI
jgi:hypothetical protein